MVRYAGRVFGVAFWLAAALPGSREVPADEPALVVEGLAGGARVLGLADLRHMGATELMTSTPWTDRPETFTGVTGRRFVEALEATGTEVIAEALNEYRVAIPFPVLATDDALLAYARNGEPMSVRDKGPVWIVFPFDADPRFLSDSHRAYSIWNLIRLEFR